MKYLILTLFIFCSACGPSSIRDLFGIRKFQIGDCLITSLNEPEEHQLHNPNYIIKDIGKRDYYSCFIYKGEITKQCDYFISYGHLWEDFYQKVPCGDSK